MANQTVYFKDEKELRKLRRLTKRYNLSTSKLLYTLAHDWLIAREQVEASDEALLSVKEANKRVR